MTESLDISDLDLKVTGASLGYEQLYVVFTCPRCHKRVFHRIDSLPYHQEFLCDNPLCKPSERNMSFVLRLALDYGTYQGLLDVPIECPRCGKSYQPEYEKDEHGNYQVKGVFPTCKCLDCEDEIPF